MALGNARNELLRTVSSPLDSEYDHNSYYMSNLELFSSLHNYIIFFVCYFSGCKDISAVTLMTGTESRGHRARVPTLKSQVWSPNRWVTIMC